MKIYPLLEQSVVEALDLIFNNNSVAERVIEKSLRSNRKFGARDRRFIAENTYDLVRHFRGLVAESGLTWSADKRDWSHEDFSKLLHLLVDLKESKSLEDVLSQKPRVEAASISDELDEIGKEELGDEWEPMILAQNKLAPIFIRANSLRATRAQVQTALRGLEIESSFLSDAPEGLKLLDRKNIFQLEPYKKGWFEIQDGASQKVAPFLDPQPGDRVVDACAGAGGKSLHLAALMGNKGKLITLDINEHKLRELKLRARRAGVSIIESRLIEGSKTIKRLSGQADRLLLDVPCSGSGVIRRHPGSKWQINKKTLNELKDTQMSLLKNYSKMLRPGGVMVYSTCSVFPSENEKQIKLFLNSPEGKSFELVHSFSTSPLTSQYDGFYACKLQL